MAVEGAIDLQSVQVAQAHDAAGVGRVKHHDIAQFRRRFDHRQAAARLFDVFALHPAHGLQIDGDDAVRTGFQRHADGDVVVETAIQVFRAVDVVGLYDRIAGAAGQHVVHHLSVRDVFLPEVQRRPGLGIHGGFFVQTDGAQAEVRLRSAHLLLRKVLRQDIPDAGKAAGALLQHAVEIEHLFGLHVQPHVPGFFVRAERDDVGVHGADGRAADHVDRYAQFPQRLPDAHLVGASRRAARQHQRRLLPLGGYLRLFFGLLTRFFDDLRAFSRLVEHLSYSMFRHSPKTSPIGSWMTRSARSSAAVSDLLRITSLSPLK